MPLFKYRAVDADGHAVNGTMDKPFSHQVVVALQEQALAVNSVRRIGREMPSVTKRALSWNDLAQLNSQLLMATRSSLPLAPSIAAMGADLTNPRIKPVLEDVRGRIEAGDSLESALDRHPRAFSPVYRALVAAGERSGDLPRVFRTLADYSKSMVEVRNNLQVALAYPIIVIVAAAMVVAGLMIKVVPVFAEIFTEFGAGLPAPTRLLVDISHTLSRHPWIIPEALLLLAAIVVSFYFNGRREQRHYWSDWLRIHVPMLGRLYMITSVMQFCRALSMLLAARVPFLESMELAAASAGNAVVQRRVRHAARELNAGVSVGQALQKAGIFDSGASWLIANAETNGNIEETLDVLAEEHARSLAYLYRSMTTVVGPALIVGIGLIVGFIVISLYLPIFSLGDAISMG